MSAPVIKTLNYYKEWMESILKHYVFQNTDYYVK